LINKNILTNNSKSKLDVNQDESLRRISNCARKKEREKDFNRLRIAVMFTVGWR
jgi:hypothetical protein